MKNPKFGLDYSISFKKAELSDSEILGEFECENPVIKNFARYGIFDSKKNVTYLFIDDESNTVVCFCSIC